MDDIAFAKWQMKNDVRSAIPSTRTSPRSARVLGSRKQFERLNQIPRDVIRIFHRQRDDGFDRFAEAVPNLNPLADFAIPIGENMERIAEYPSKPGALLGVPTNPIRKQ